MHIFILIVILFSAISAQDFTEKYNHRLERIEYYDPSGLLIGYSVENTKYNRLEFYDSTGTIVRSYPLPEKLMFKEGFDNGTPKKGIRRWNHGRQRYELFDSLGNVAGYYTFDAQAQKWHFYRER